jgi:hypothetical protein
MLVAHAESFNSDASCDVDEVLEISIAENMQRDCGLAESLRHKIVREIVRPGLAVYVIRNSGDWTLSTRPRLTLSDWSS